MKCRFKRRRVSFILISNVKTSKYEFKNVESLTEKIIDASAKKYSHLGIEAKVNISRWFEPLKLRQLLAIKDEIDKFGNEQEKALFQVALAGIVRDASKVDHRCVNHIVMDQDKKTVDVFPAFRDNVIKIHGSVLEVQKHYHEKNQCLVKWGTALNLDFSKNESVDLVFSHPPYMGAIDYYNIFKLATNILGFDDKKINEMDISTSSINNFMGNMNKVFLETMRVLKRGKFAVYIIGDVRKEGEIIPLGCKFISEAQKIGFKLMDIFIWVQSKKAGMSVARRGHHIDHNYILIFKK